MNYLLVLITLLSFVCQAYAAPNMDTIVGSFTNYETVTIKGVGFGGKPVASPLKWDEFEDGSIAQELNGWTLYANQPNSNPKYSDAIVYAGSQSAMCDFNSEAAYTSTFQMLGGSWDELFMSFYYRAEFVNPSCYDSQPNRNFKIIRVEGDNGDLSGDQHEGVPLFALEHRAPSNGNAEVAVRAQYDPTLIYDTFYDGQLGWEDGVWNKVEIYVSVVSGKKTFKMWENGIERTPSGATLNDIWIPYMGKDNSKFNEVKFGFYFDTSSTYGSCRANVYFDDVYVDTTQARVEICDNVVWSNCRHKELQVPNSWSSDGTAIEITVNQGSFAEGQAAYLYVIDAEGNVSNDGQGFEITIGGDGNSVPADNSPALTFTAPTVESTYTVEASSEASEQVTIAGTASDDNTIQSVTYATDKGGAGNASSTNDFATWSVPVTVNKNETVVTTITVTDNAGQSTSKTMTIACTYPVGWDATVQTGDNTWADSGVTYCVRLLVEGDSVADSAGQVLLGFQGRDSGDYTIRNVSIAQRDTAGTEGDVVDSTWKQVTFGSSAWNSNITVGAGTEKFSDPVSLNLTPGTDYYVTFKIDSPSVYLNPPTGYRELYFDSADHTSDVDWGGNGYSVAQDYHALSKIYIYNPDDGISPPPDFQLDL